MTYRPMLFSAAYSEQFERARRQSELQDRPKFLLKRGFHSEGGLAGWGYYLEPTYSEEPSIADDDSEQGEEGATVEDVSEGRRHARARPHSQTVISGAADERHATSGNSGHPAVRTFISSHGRRIAHAIVRRVRMAVKTYTLISLWFALTIPVIFWDAGYCFFRPRSMVGGDLHWLWKPYALYQEIDYVYGLKALQEGDGFTNAQSALNIVENFMNIGYLYLAHVAGSPAAPLLGFASAVMTLSKTVLYWLQEYYCGYCAVGHNDLQTLVVYWIIPNGLWLLVPSYIVWRFGKDIGSALRVASKSAQKTKKQ